ncbi:tRNA (N6-threonylcarbamoyladenosine(37)-N6)-methyltransferase TrmO [Desulfobulbus oligotrophicus]|uniref:tRNA (N6-threonylcarbamoyladenosine(37)-N6)-methyltransferase TrmO n=1 Tax=Desulfobulbus oligotrophicus TaxID=1909699 RepID=A0A7T5VBC5_9BACT|nr:tRNA (N6-threonylcarbamoyladenosine(37)-N6)-methyltransferase TrmO [Desulfobulbus oligotrophicus]QQG64735.1 tRNA (N6-threonylcarbamoyladenosine(37)-N6)-methyltransferase TrmO [Desulfobulbus oligotrophicus]
MSQPILQPIGIVHCDITSREDAPKNYDISDRKGVLEIYPAFQDGLQGIAAGHTIVVLFWLDRSDRTRLLVYPRGDRSRGLHGVFATRSPDRPNPIALSEVRILAIRNNCLEVVGLDVLDGTPIIDIKKKITPEDRPTA